jgi:hypothetical protein
MKSRNKELTWEIRETHKEFYLGNLREKTALEN